MTRQACIDCKFFAMRVGKNDRRVAFCKRPIVYNHNFDLVLGATPPTIRPLMTECSMERWKGECGEYGLFFEEASWLQKTFRYLVK